MIDSIITAINNRFTRVLLFGKSYKRSTRQSVIGDSVTRSHIFPVNC